jgi:hypothetical protein
MEAGMSFRMRSPEQDGSEMVPLRAVMAQQARTKAARLLFKRVVTNQLRFFGGFGLMNEDLTRPNGNSSPEQSERGHEERKRGPLRKRKTVPVAALRGETEAADRAEAQALEAIKVAREQLLPYGFTIDDKGNITPPPGSRNGNNGQAAPADEEKFERLRMLFELHGYRVGDDGSLLPMTISGGKP